MAVGKITPVSMMHQTPKGLVDEAVLAGDENGEMMSLDIIVQPWHWSNRQNDNGYDDDAESEDYDDGCILARQ